MVDVQNVHISLLMYRAGLHYRRQSEHQNQQSTDKNYLSAIGINFPTPSPCLQPSGKLRKTLISLWRIRILGFHRYENTPLQPYWAMTLLVTLTLLLGNVTEFRQPLQVQIHLEMPRILVQLGHTQRT